MYVISSNGKPLTCFVVWACLGATLWSGPISVASADSSAVTFTVDSSSHRLEMIVNTSRILKLDKEVPRVMVNNPDVVRVSPLAPNQIQVFALKPGVTQINLFDEDEGVRSVDVVVFADARQLEMVLRTHFPKAAIRIRPLNSSVMLSGYVDRSEHISRIVSIASDYYPKVINNINVGGVQQISLHVKLLEVSRTKLRSIGMDFANFNSNDSVITSAAGLISAAGTTAAGIAGTGLDTVQFGVVDGANTFLAAVRFLQDNNLAKVLAEPTLVTVSGRPASFLSGGEFPIIVPQSLGVNGVEFKQFGTRVDFVPIVQGSGNIRLEVRPQVSEIDNSRSVEINGILIPALRTRWVDTAVEMRAGQTLALAGLIQSRIEAEKVGFPLLHDIPFLGNLFGRNEEENSEVELLVIVRPELVDALDPHEAQHIIGPGERTTSPTDCEFYGRGYIESPNCYPYPACGFGPGPVSGGAMPASGMPIMEQEGMIVPPTYESAPTDETATPLSRTEAGNGPLVPASAVMPTDGVASHRRSSVAPVVSVQDQRARAWAIQSRPVQGANLVQNQSTYPLQPPSRQENDVRVARTPDRRPTAQSPPSAPRTNTARQRTNGRDSEFHSSLIGESGYDEVN